MREGGQFGCDHDGIARPPCRAVPCRPTPARVPFVPFLPPRPPSCRGREKKRSARARAYVPLPYRDSCTRRAAAAATFSAPLLRLSPTSPPPPRLPMAWTPSHPPRGDLARAGSSLSSNQHDTSFFLYTNPPHIPRGARSLTPTPRRRPARPRVEFRPVRPPPAGRVCWQRSAWRHPVRARAEGGWGGVDSANDSVRRPREMWCVQTRW